MRKLFVIFCVHFGVVLAVVVLLCGFAFADPVQFTAIYTPGQPDTFGAFSFNFILDSLPTPNTVFTFAPVTINGFTVAAGCENSFGWAFNTTSAGIICNSSEILSGVSNASEVAFLFVQGPGAITSVPFSGSYTVLGGDLGFVHFISGTGTIDASSTAVPEPSSLLLLGIGLLVAVGGVRRKLHR